MIRWTTLLVFACSLLPVCSAKAAENGASLRRWAVVADSLVQQTGLPDLLTAELAGNEGWELVERDQLSLATRELELSSLGEASRAGERLKLGRLLSADALVLLSWQEAGDKTVLKLVVSECNYGARLTIELVDFDPAQVEEAVPRIEASLQRVRERFQQGIEYLIGVPHFVSRSLTHDYDRLQSGYAHLLQAALAAFPGVAALEVEEARAIGRELALSANPGLRRAPLLLLDAEYVVERPQPTAAPQVRFDLKIRNGDEVRSLRQRVLRLEKAADFVARELPPQLVNSRRPAAELKTSPEQQFSWLVERANAFAQLGEWQPATGLREAALLLRPRDAAQRKALIHDYQRLMTRPLHVPVEDQKPGNLELARAIRERVDAYLAALSHFEHLIRQREISPDEAVKRLFSLQTHDLLGVAAYRILNVDGIYWRMGQESLVLAEEAEERFLTECYPDVIAMAPQEERARRKLVNRWQEPLIKAAFLRVDRTYRTREDLKFLETILTQILPDGLEVPFALTQVHSLISHQPNVPLPQEAITHDDWDAFLQGLSKSEHRVAAIFARYCMIREEREQRSGSAEEARKLLAEVELLLEDYDALGDAGGSYPSRQREWMYGRIRDLRFHLKRELAPTPPPARVSPARKRPPGWEKDPAMWKLYGYPTTMGKLKFEPIELKLRSGSGEAEPLKERRWRTYGGWGPLTDVTACGDRLDVWWNTGAVLAMREKGILEGLAVDPQPIFTDVKWDGRHLWIGTRRAGLWLVDLDSLQVVARIGEEAGLPPSDRRMILHPIEPGRACVSGSFGEHSRAWCALVSWTGGAAQVKVFHEATHVPTAQTRRSGPPAEPDIHLVFEPAWLHEYDSAEDRRSLLVGRDAPTLEGKSRPLLIDLDSLDVRSFGHTLSHADHRYSSSYYSHDGHLLEASEFHVVHRPPPGETLSGGEDWRRLCTNVTGAGLISRQILPFDGWLYVPGSCWFRLHPETFDEEMLVPGRLPNEYSMRHFSVSAHYGLLAWNSEDFFQVLIDDSSSSEGTGSE